MNPAKTTEPPAIAPTTEAPHPHPAWPGAWLAEETGRADPASQAWSLMHWLMISSKSRFVAINQEFDLSPQQAIALRVLGGGPRSMGELARFLACDSSNVTGMTDRLEERGMVRREPDPKDRRVKMLVLTEDGERVRHEVTERLAEPPEWITSLPESDQRMLREILAKAVEAGGDPVPKPPHTPGH